MSLAARLLLAPYLAGAFVNSRSWTRHEPEPVASATASGSGACRWHARPRTSRPSSICAPSCRAQPAPAPGCCIPMLDLVPPQPAQLRERRGEHRARARPRGPVLVCCALGYSRSAAAVATWLLDEQSRENVGEAIEKIRAGAASHRHRLGAARRHRDRSGRGAHDRAHASSCSSARRPCSIRAERSIGCRARSPRRRSSASWSIRRSSGRHPGRRSDSPCWLRSQASRRCTSRSASASTPRCSISWRARPRRQISPGPTRRSLRLGLLPADKTRPPAEARVAGARRLFGFQILALVAQVLSVLVGACIAWAWR